MSVNAYPPGDDRFEDKLIAKVGGEPGGGWSITQDDGWSLFVSKDSPVVPTVGMTARFYGDGMGRPVRGLFLNGVKVFYRTEAEDKEHSEIEMYGADAVEWLRRWDAGQTVWSIEMGGLGPGYEQCIHITAAEILRHLLATKYDAASWEETKIWKRDVATIEKDGFANKTIEALGLSGAQWGAALNLAARLYRDGPRAVLTDKRVKDRHIQVSREFPSVPREAAAS